MKTINKLLITSLITIFLVSSISPALAQNADAPRVENREGSVFIRTPYLNVKLHEGKPDLFVWAKNQTNNDRKIAVFHIGFYHVAELFGEDLVVDSRTELGGKIYNLVSDEITWTLNVENFTNEIRATQTSNAIANGAIIQFVYHIYLEDVTITQDLNGTIVSYDTKALKEIKFDIIVENWEFSPDAVGLLFNVKVHELRYRHRIRNGDKVYNPEENQQVNQSEEARTERIQDPKKNGIEFKDDRDNRYAYFAWTPEADVFDENGTYVETILATATAASYGIDQNFGRGLAFGREFINLILVYPNYGDGMTMVHDPILGIDDSVKVSVPLTAVLIAIPVAAFAILVIRRKR